MKTNGTQHPNGATPKPDALHVAFALDKSGSMGHLANAVVTGFDEFLDELRKDGGDTLFTLTVFDTEFRHVHVAEPLDDVPSLAKTGYRPGGMTALFDAVAHAVIDTDKRLEVEGRADEKVMVVVMTDGFENSSTDFTAETIAELVAGYDERPNWTFVYLGAAHGSLEDARDAADRMAFKRGNAMRWTADEASARKSMGSLAAATKQRRFAGDMKSERLFADAGQGEADYSADAPADTSGDGSSPIERRNIRDMFGPNGGPRKNVTDIPITELLSNLGLKGDAATTARAILEDAGVTNARKQRISLTKTELVESTIDEHLQRVCHSCRTRTVVDGREIVQVPPPACPVCRGSANRRAVEDMVEACGRSNVRRLVFVGGSPTTRREFDELVNGRLELRLIDGTGPNDGRKAQRDIDWADLVVVLGGTQLAHKVSTLYTDTGDPVARRKLITTSRRGIEAIADEITRSDVLARRRP